MTERDDGRRLDARHAGEPPGAGSPPPQGPRRPLLRGPFRGAPPSPGLAMLAELMNNHLDAGYAEAHRRRATRQPPSPATRRLRSAATSATLAVIGMVLAMAYHHEVARAPDAARAKASLIRDVKARSVTTDDLQKKADRLRVQVAREREAALASTEAGQTTAAELRSLETAVGLGPVLGPGIVVTVGDGPPPKDPVTGEITGENYPGRLVDRDLQELVNAFWREGAEAVAIDGQRLTPTTTIRLAGEAILVDQLPVSSPYRIEVIGDPLTLARRFGGSAVARRFRGYVARYEMTFEITSEPQLRLSAAPASTLRYARERVSPQPSAPSTPTPSPGLPSPRPSGSPPEPVPSPPGGGR